MVSCYDVQGTLWNWRVGRACHDGYVVQPKTDFTYSSCMRQRIDASQNGVTGEASPSGYNLMWRLTPNKNY
jgi:hypothetical protein